MPTNSPSDEILLERIRTDDREALEHLIERYQGHILRFSLKMCGNRPDAEDVAQDALLAAARTIRSFRGASSISTWLYSITRSFCIKKRRKSKFAPDHETPLDTAPPLPDPNQNPEDIAASREIERAVEQAIAHLDPKYREVLVLRDIEGLTAPEVAKITELSVAAVKSRLHRARVSLRTALSTALNAERPEDVPGPPGLPNLVEAFSQHLEGEIDAKVCAQMQDYIDQNPRAKRMCDSLNQVLSLCKNAPTPEVPQAIQDQVRASIRNLG